MTIFCLVFYIEFTGSIFFLIFLSICLIKVIDDNEFLLYQQSADVSRHTGRSWFYGQRYLSENVQVIIYQIPSRLCPPVRRLGTSVSVVATTKKHI